MKLHSELYVSYRSFLNLRVQESFKFVAQKITSFMFFIVYFSNRVLKIKIHVDQNRSSLKYKARSNFELIISNFCRC